MEYLWCKKLERNACLASRKFIQDPRLIGCDSAKRDSRRTSRNDSLRPSEIFLFLRSFLRSAAGCSPAAFFQRRGNEKLFKTSPRAMATCTRERERERKVIRQSNRSERRFNQANGKLEAECCPFFFPLERIQVDYALDSISFQRFRWFPRRCFSAPNIGAARGERYA